MTIPEPAVSPSAEIPIAQSIVVPPPVSAILDEQLAAQEAIQPPAQPRRKPIAARPSPRFEQPAPELQPIEFAHVPEPEPEPLAIDTAPVEAAPTQAATVPFHRIAAALAVIASLAAVVVLVSTNFSSGEGTKPEAVDRPVPVAIAQVAPEPPPALPTPAPPPAPPVLPVPATPAPDSVVSTPPATMPEPPAKPEPPRDQAIPSEPSPKVEAPAPRPAPAPAPAARRPLVIRRRERHSQDALRQQLCQVPEIMLSHETETVLFSYHGISNPRQAVTNARSISQAGFLGPVLNRATPRIPQQEGQGMHVAHPHDNSLATVNLYKEMQPELGFLPWRLGEQCQLDRESAEELEAVSRSLRNYLQATTPAGDNRPDADKLRAILFSRLPARGSALVTNAIRQSFGPRGIADVRWNTQAAIPALMQLLMAERTPERLVLVDLLAEIPGPAASKALARLAIFDLAPEVRERSLVLLQDRPTSEYQSTLIDGFRYPWAPVADHAAEAIVAIDDREAIPNLVELLNEPDPAHSRTEVRDGHPITYSRTLVQVNHLRNCLLCHEPSTNTTTDLVRGRVPTEGMPIPPPQEYYGNTSPGMFVRAEVTYLKQDFSVTQPVEQAGFWPAYQRYDYVVSERPVTAHHPARPKGKAREHVHENATFPQRESALFALRELTGQDVGAESAAWKAATRPKPAEE